MANQKKITIRNKSDSPLDNLIGNIAARAINAVAAHGINRLSQEASRFFGVNGTPSVNEQIALNRSRLQLEQQEAETAKVKAVSEMEIQMYAYRLEEKQIAIQEKRRQLEAAQEEIAQLALPEAQMVVDGALTIPQDRGGIISPDEPAGYEEWLDSLPYGKVILVLGKRGSGKTALGARIAEFISATYGLAIYWVGLPEAARNLLPHWVKLVNDPTQVPTGSIVLADEAGMRYASLAFASRQNKQIRTQLMIARHAYTSLIFAVQSSRDLEASIVRQADSIIFKMPSFNQPETERGDIKPMARKAAEVFQQIPAEKRAASAMVFDDLFTGIITTIVPSFWSDDLSHVYRHIDLNQLESNRTRAGELDQVVKEEAKLLEADSLDSQILKLRSEGHGVEKISKLLSVTPYRVRKCLNI
jgi:energy-coupling factor transporter ATP-binding protein EcfA2